MTRCWAKWKVSSALVPANNICDCMQLTPALCSREGLLRCNLACCFLLLLWFEHFIQHADRGASSQLWVLFQGNFPNEGSCLLDQLQGDPGQCSPALPSAQAEPWMPPMNCAMVTWACQGLLLWPWQHSSLQHPQYRSVSVHLLGWSAQLLGLAQGTPEQGTKEHSVNVTFLQRKGGN